MRAGNTQNAFRFGVLGWSPPQSSYFTSGTNLVSVLTQSTCIQPLLKRLGNRSFFQAATLLSAVSYIIQSQSWRPHGSSALRKAVQYGAAVLVLALRSDWQQQHARKPAAAASSQSNCSIAKRR